MTGNSHNNFLNGQKARLEEMLQSGQNKTKVQRALQKIEKELYGVCASEDCRAIIPDARLALNPIEEHCVHCKTELEEIDRRRNRGQAPYIQRMTTGHLF